MQNIVQKKEPLSGEKTKSTNDTNELCREKIALKILWIIDPRFHHTHAPLARTQIEILRIIELKNLSTFLSSDIIQRADSSKRPECPLKNPRQHSLARYDYKKGMQEYISSFGYTFSEFPCNYGTSFLEAFANYCEYKVHGEKQALVLPFKKK